LKTATSEIWGEDKTALGAGVRRRDPRAVLFPPRILQAKCFKMAARRTK